MILCGILIVMRQRVDYSRYSLNFLMTILKAFKKQQLILKSFLQIVVNNP